MLAARQESIADEELIGVIWWQLKSLRLADATVSSIEAGMKDWPYSKAKQSLKNFKPGELSILSDSLLTVYHSARAGRVDMGLALERWILNL